MVKHQCCGCMARPALPESTACRPRRLSQLELDWNITNKNYVDTTCRLGNSSYCPLNLCGSDCKGLTTGHLSHVSGAFEMLLSMTVGSMASGALPFPMATCATRQRDLLECQNSIPQGLPESASEALMLEVVLLQHILCGAQIVYGTVSEAMCKIYWHLNLSGSGSPGTQVKRRQWIVGVGESSCKITEKWVVGVGTLTSKATLLSCQCRFTQYVRHQGCCQEFPRLDWFQEAHVHETFPS